MGIDRSIITIVSNDEGILRSTDDTGYGA